MNRGDEVACTSLSSCVLQQWPRHLNVCAIFLNLIFIHPDPSLALNMASIRHTLTCLVHGHSAPQFFSIKAHPTDTVDDIKTLIVNEPRSGFSAPSQFILHAAMLTLGHPRDLSRHSLRLLSPLLDISTVLVRKTIIPVLHIMVERIQEGTNGKKERDVFSVCSPLTETKVDLPPTLLLQERPGFLPLRQ